MDTSNMIFVFGSNEGGIHGAGAARYALDKKGAKIGVAFGMSGKSFAIPTKDRSIRHTLPLIDIRNYVLEFFQFAELTMDLYEFQVTRIGCGLAGLKDEQVAPMFMDAPDNCFFDTAWHPWLSKEHRYWGTF